MSAAPPVPRPTWTRRVAAWSILGFFVSLIVLTYAAVDVWNAGDLVASGYLAGLASAVPVLLVLVPYYATPIWGITVPVSVEDVAAALARASVGRHAEPLEAREGAFARCVAVIRFDDPPCTVGWYPTPVAPGPAAFPQTVVVLQPRRGNRKALAEFREAVARALADSGPSPATRT